MLPRYFLAIVLFFTVLAGCASTDTELRDSLSIYDNGIRKSTSATDKFDMTVTHHYTFDEVFDAAKKAVFRKGLIIQVEDKKKGLLMGNGQVSRILGTLGPQMMSFTYSIKITEVSSEPVVQLNIMVDHFYDHYFYAIFAAKGGHFAHQLGNELLADVQKILSTY
jgi:hypothetical protein